MRKLMMLWGLICMLFVAFATVGCEKAAPTPAKPGDKKPATTQKTTPTKPADTEKAG